ncbi:MAG: GNAT family N-acetyltransferase [Rhodospirillales bacterium]|nr:GNAT family N-acetyltransferase [Rhodospirillales bacterium]MCB9996008.1 GNAT family N-acetyltransferase [Rhodospirillales bacterium]
MGISQLNIESVEVKLAETEAEVEASQRLRYKVFYEEYAAQPNEEMARERRDMDAFDAVADHLIVVDRSIEDPIDRIVGTYRMLRNDVASRHGRFYTSDEYDIQPLLDNGSNLLELGRSCVLADYRTRPVLQLLWEGIIEYMLSHDVDTMFGCASLHGTDIDALSEQLAYLHHYHLAPEDMRPKALAERYVDMNLHAAEDLDAREIFKSLPPLIKGYLRVGCTIGEGAVVDEQFNTTDVCIMLPMKEFAPRYRKHYARKINQRQNGSDNTDSDVNDENVAARSAV